MDYWSHVFSATSQFTFTASVNDVVSFYFDSWLLTCMLAWNLVWPKSSCHMARGSTSWSWFEIYAFSLWHMFLILFFAILLLFYWFKGLHWRSSAIWFFLWLFSLFRFCREDCRAAFTWQFSVSLLDLIERMCKLDSFRFSTTFSVFEHWECKADFWILIIIFRKEIVLIVDLWAPRLGLCLYLRLGQFWKIFEQILWSISTFGEFFYYW